MNSQFLQSATTDVPDRSYLKNANHNSIQAGLDNDNKTSERTVHWTRAKVRGRSMNCSNLHWCSLPYKNHQVFNCEEYNWRWLWVRTAQRVTDRRNIGGRQPQTIRCQNNKITQLTTKHMKHSPTKTELIYVLILVCLMFWIVPIYEYLMGL